MGHLIPEGLERPGRAATAEEVVVFGEDARAQGDREGDRWPVVGIARDAPPGDGFKMVVCMSRDDFDRVVVNQLLGLPLDPQSFVIGESFLLNNKK